MTIEELKQNIYNNEYVRFLGLDFVELKEGYAVGRIPLKNDVKNPYQSMHGGVLYSMADIVAGCAACAYGKSVTTIDGTLSYIKPAIGTDYVTCEANVIRQGKSIAFYRVNLLSDDHETLASGQFQFYVMSK